MNEPVKVGLLWRQEWDPPGADGVDLTVCRLHGVFAAFAELGVAAVPVVYSDDTVEKVRLQLLDLDGVLVWVNPMQNGLGRSKLDPLLRQVAEQGVWVSAHPDVIGRMATKKVLVDTRKMSWGTDTRLYVSAEQLRKELPIRLADGARVVKQERGMGGQGVFKVELQEGKLAVEDASGDSASQLVTIDDFTERCTPYFTNAGVVVDQPFLETISDGMIRVYMSHDRVVGFARQYPRGLRPASAGEPPPGKMFELPSAPQYQELRERMESEWVPEMQRLLGLETHELPVIWDADFLYGPSTPAGDETYLLCEINASSTFAFPEHAMPTVARAAIDRIRDRS